MTIYFDSSALVKLVQSEDESAALERFVDSHQANVQVTSALARTELVRAVAAHGPAAVADARILLLGISQISVTAALLDAAAELPVDPPLRSLDAIHVASAHSIRADLRALVTYDRRMLAAAQALGLPTVSPS